MPPSSVSGPPKPPSRKIFIGCGVLVLLALLAGSGLWWLLSNAFVTDPEKVAAILAEIAPGAEVPDGYQGAFAIDMLGHQTVLITPEQAAERLRVEPENSVQALDLGGQVLSTDGGTVAMIVVSNSGPDQRQLAAGGDDADDSADPAIIEDLGIETITIDGTELSFQKHRVTRSDYVTLEYYGVVPTRGASSAVVTFSGREGSVDRLAVQALLRSMVSGGR